MSAELTGDGRDLDAGLAAGLEGEFFGVALLWETNACDYTSLIGQSF